MPKCPRSSGPVRKELGCWTDIAALSLTLRGRIFSRKTGVHFSGKCSIYPACSSARHDGAQCVRARRPCELRIGRARGAHEGANLAGILLPRRALDARGHIDTVRPRDAQRLLEIAGIKPAREHER